MRRQNLIGTPLPFILSGSTPPSRQSARLFFQSRELGLPHPLTRKRFCPPPLVLGGGGHCLARDGGGGVPIPTRGETLYSAHSSTLGKYVLCSRPEAAPTLTFLSSRKSVFRARVAALFRLVLSLLWAFTAAATPSIVLSAQGGTSRVRRGLVRVRRSLDRVRRGLVYSEQNCCTSVLGSIPPPGTPSLGTLLRKPSADDLRSAGKPPQLRKFNEDESCKNTVL
jgi:hypothetical protein